jgi:hypothetical protein
MNQDIYKIVRDNFLKENAIARKNRELALLAECSNILLLETSMKNYMHMLKHYSEYIMKRYGYTGSYYTYTHRLVRIIEICKCNFSKTVDALTLSDIDLYKKEPAADWPV